MSAIDFDRDELDRRSRDWSASARHTAVALFDELATLRARLAEVEKERDAEIDRIADFVEEKLDWDRSTDAALYAIPEAIRARAYRSNKP
jgi:hypothetical protein